MKTFLKCIITLLTLSSLIHAKDFKGAEYRTKESFLYGRFEVRFKSFQKEGALTSFFTYNDLGGAWNEIDIEVMGRYSNTVQLNTIVPTQAGNHVHNSYVNFNPSLDFHSYAFEWTPEYVAWFIDGAEVHRQTGDHITQLNLPQKLMMNVWNPQWTDWAGVWSADQTPCFAYYDWISYSEYTPGKGTYGTGSNFTPKWRDELDSWDKVRWEMATHTFGGNLCDFTPDNITFKDGKMILSLTDNVNTGYNDKTGPLPVWGRIHGNRVWISFSEELDKAAAENAANYLLSGYTVESVKRLDDLKSVLLSVSQQDSTEGETVIVLNMKDRWTPGNVTGFKSIHLYKAAPLQFPVKINAGGNAVNGFLADQEWGPDKEYGFMNGPSAENPVLVRGTADSAVYRTERNGLVCYKIRVPNGVYNVKLMMAERYFAAPDRRVFNVLIEGNQVLEKFDILNLVSKNTACEKTIKDITVYDEELEIFFEAEKDVAVVNGIVIEKVSSSADRQGSAAPENFNLEQNFPNPFNGMTRINFTLKEKTDVFFRVIDSLGRQVYSRKLDGAASGRNTIHWSAADNNGRSLASGVYYYSISTSEMHAVKKLILMK